MSEENLNTLKADLSGQVAIVTGAAQGLGQRIAITLAANGANIASLGECGTTTDPTDPVPMP